MVGVRVMSILTFKTCIMHKHTHTHTCMHARTHAHIHTRMHARTHARTYTHTHTHRAYSNMKQKQYIPFKICHTIQIMYILKYKDKKKGKQENKNNKK
jgi:hypothetical protein